MFAPKISIQQSYDFTLFKCCRFNRSYSPCHAADTGRRLMRKRYATRKVLRRETRIPLSLQPHGPRHDNKKSGWGLPSPIAIEFALGGLWHSFVRNSNSNSHSKNKKVIITITKTIRVVRFL